MSIEQSFENKDQSILTTRCTFCRVDFDRKDGRGRNAISHGCCEKCFFYQVDVHIHETHPDPKEAHQRTQLEIMRLRTIESQLHASHPHDEIRHLKEWIERLQGRLQHWLHHTKGIEAQEM